MPAAPVGRLLASIVEEARQLSGGRHVFECDIDDTLGMRGDAAELVSALSNLIFNAVRYSPGGGQIEVGWRSVSSGALFEVRDHGVGIEPQHLDRLTERFYRVDIGRARADGGTGLGLAIVKHVLRRHRSALRIESTIGVGSRFWCVFPEDLAAHRAPPENVMES